MDNLNFSHAEDQNTTRCIIQHIQPPAAAIHPRGNFTP
jgi:hypothetical protein